MSDDLAKTRFLRIQIMRLSGVALAVVGALTIAGKIDLPIEAGYALLFIGVLDALFMPTLLARRWKSKRP